MAVKMVAGGVFVEKLPQSGKAQVGPVLAVSQSLRRGVGHQNVHPPGFVKRPEELPDPAPHFPIGVLVGAIVILPAAPQTGDPQTVEFHHLAVDVVAALWGLLVVAGVVVSGYVKHRAPGHGHEEAQIAGL